MRSSVESGVLGMGVRLGRLTGLVVALAVVGLAVAGCSTKAMMEKIASPEDQALAGIVIHDIQAGPSGDADLLPRLLPELAQKLGPATAQMRGYMPSDPKAASRLVDASFNTMIGDDGHTTRTSYLAYEVDGAGGQRALVRLMIVRQDKAPALITGLYVNQLSKPVEEITAFSFSGKPAGSYLILALAVLSFLTIVTSEIVLFRTKWIRLKWLWAIGCLFGVVQISVDWATGATAVQPLMIQLLGAFAVKQGMLAPWRIGFGIPVASIAFLLLRKRLQKPPAAAGQGEEAVATF